jgi:N-succinyldiaminopimelate aminotransferase
MLTHTNRAAERVSGFGTSIFTEISALAVQHQAVNLGQGFPDFAGPTWLKQAAIDAINADLNQYAPAPGLPRLREAIAATWAAAGWREVDPISEVTITSGATEALFGAIMALVNPGDEVIVFEPFYDAYVPDIVMAGGVPKYVRLHPPELTTDDRQPTTIHGDTPQSSVVGRQSSSWHFDPAELAAAFSPRTKLLLLNTPHNPTGKVFSRGELEQIAALCIEHDVVVITDEVYDQLVFGELPHLPLATLPGMWERTLTINSVGKTFSVTGWKIGYGVGPAYLNTALRSAHQWVTFATATPLQAAAALALDTARTGTYYSDLRAEYRERLELLQKVLQGIGLPTIPVEGSYFIMADIAATGHSDDAAFCRWLTSEIGVAAIPPSAFYATPEGVPLLARFCFAKKLETIHAAAARLAKISFQTSA